MAKYCAYAVWRDDQKRVIDAMRDRGLFSLCLLSEYFASWWWVLHESRLKVALTLSLSLCQALSKEILSNGLLGDIDGYSSAFSSYQSVDTGTSNKRIHWCSYGRLRIGID